jgi:hypothetical protein
MFRGDPDTSQSDAAYVFTGREKQQFIEPTKKDQVSLTQDQVKALRPPMHGRSISQAIMENASTLQEFKITHIDPVVPTL